MKRILLCCLLLSACASSHVESIPEQTQELMVLQLLGGVKPDGDAMYIRLDQDGYVKISPAQLEEIKSTCAKQELNLGDIMVAP